MSGSSSIHGAVEPSPVSAGGPPGPLGLLHIGKTGGTALTAALRPWLARHPERRLTCFEHEMTMPLFCRKHPDGKVGFFVREPVAIFVSGFNSRLRKGQPRFHSEWSAAEAEAFARFRTPDALASALADDDPAAIAAMAAIFHVARGLTAYLDSYDFLARNADRVFFIGQLESFERDFARLRTLLDIDESAALPSDDIAAHRAPPGMSTALGARSVAALAEWYAEDIRIHEWCVGQAWIR